MIDVIVILRLPIMRIVNFSIADPGDIILIFERIFQKNKHMIIGHFRKSSLVCFFYFISCFQFQLKDFLHSIA